MQDWLVALQEFCDGYLPDARLFVERQESGDAIVSLALTHRVTAKVAAAMVTEGGRLQKELAFELVEELVRLLRDRQLRYAGRLALAGKPQPVVPEPGEMGLGVERT